MSAAPQVELQPVEVHIRVMLTPSRALDQWLDDLERRDYSAKTVREYSRIVGLLVDTLPHDFDVSRITLDAHINPFLLRYRNRARNTKATAEGAVCSFFGWMRFRGKITRDPTDMLVHTRRAPSEDLDVVTVSTDDVRRMLFLAEGWPERLAIGVLAYLGPRRQAVSQLRISDYDRARGRIRFREKGGKTIYKPIPGKLDLLIEEAIAAGVYDEQDYLVPSLRPSQLGAKERDAQVIWRLVKRVADRAHVDAHVHSLRAAFACFYLESGGELLGLKELMGHKRLSTTEIYLRKLDKERSMEPVRSLSWDVADPDTTGVLEVSSLRETGLGAVAGVTGPNENVRSASVRMGKGLKPNTQDEGSAA